MDKKWLFNDGWEFTKRPVGTGVSDTNLPGVLWSGVDIPHDWMIYDTNAFYATGEGWYRKRFTADTSEGRRISLYFEGVYMNSSVYINDKPAGEWKYGYSSFEFEITSLLTEGENEIKVRVIYEAPNSRWYSGAGIYRNVWLKTTEPARLVTDGIYLSAQKEQEGWKVLLQTEAVTSSGSSADNSHKAVNARIKHSIYDREGGLLAEGENSVDMTAAVTADHQALSVTDPILWDITNPYLYTLKTELIVDGRTVDEEIQRFGFRTIRVDSNTGFYLNDRPVKLYGACQHHDLGALGSAVNKAAIRRQFTRLQEMGINAVRTSHNMPAVELMELADEMGMLIVSEAFDMWERSKTEFDYARFFPEWHEKDVASWIRRDRNHPSIIMWSIGNEIYDTHADARGLEVAKRLKELVLVHDPLHNGLDTIGSNFMAWENAQRCAAEISVAGYNYGEWLYEEHHKKYPDWVIYGSETASTVQSRGIYHFPLNKKIVSHEDEQCSSLDNSTTNWGAKNTQRNIIDDRDAKYSLGQFIWTGFDYIGEPTPYSTKNSYFGQIDTAGFPKDQFYLYQAEWTDYKVKPMVHLLPYWDFNEGQLIDIKIYSNAPKVELFFNDKSLGTYEIDHIAGQQLAGVWQLPYKPGVLKAAAYDEAGNLIAADIQSSFGDAAKLAVKPDKTKLTADGLDLIFAEISAVDDKGVPVANANNRVEVEVSGAGRLVGLDNGDSTDYDQYKGTSRKLFGGKLLAIIAAKQEPGEIHVKVSSVGLETEVLTLEALPAGRVTGVSSLTENAKSEPNQELPVRKIALTRYGGSSLDKACKSVKITAKLYPENTTYPKIEWKVVTSAGIVSNTAKVEAEGNSAVVTALGDGEFRLRCCAYNGKKTPEILSELEFTAEGLGAATFNPYEFVIAGLYNASNYELGVGLQNGVATNDTETQIGFRSLDFGAYGSDEITIPIFYHDSNILPIELWEGMPSEPGAKLLLTTNYEAQSIWGRYIPNTFKLPRRLRGITTLCIVVDKKLHLLGFEFKKPAKAYELLSALDRDNIYGDSFTITEDAIQHIGNNVTIEFENMDFGTEGFTKLILCGRSRTENNTIHVRFAGEEGSSNQIAEFGYSEDYIEREYRLTPVTGNQKVSFIFLPGSNFDLKWFRFVK